jgi:hypothetical protein
MAKLKAYFLDIENVGSKDIDEFLKRDKTSIVVLVTGPNIKLGGELLTELSKPKSRLEVLHSPVQADQMADKLLLVKVGEYFSKYQERDLIIVSKDKGFQKAAEILSQHWSKTIAVIGKLPSSTNGKKKATPPKKNPKKQSKKDPPVQAPKPEKNTASVSKDAKAYWATVELRKPRNRPKTQDALISSIQNIRKLGLKSSADAIVNWLKQTGKLSIKNGKITWADA